MDMVKNIKKYILGLLIIVTLFLVGMFVLDNLKNARVNVLVAPIGATVKIDGKEIKGSTRFYPKEHVLVELSKEGFKKKEFYIDLKSNQTVMIHDFLENEKEGLSYYKTSKKDFELLKIMQNDKTKDFFNKIERASMIKRVLPIKNYEGEDKTKIEFTGIYESSNKNCENCLKIEVNYPFDVEKVKKVFLKYGYDYEDYIIER